MLTTRSKRPLRGWFTSVVMVSAAVFLTTTIAFGQGSPEQQNLNISKWISGGQWGSLWSMDFGPASNKTSRPNLGFSLGHPRDVRGFAMSNPARAWTMTNRFGAPNLGATHAGAFSPNMAPGHSSAVPALSVIPNIITNDTFTNSGGNHLWSTENNWSGVLPNSNTNVLITGTGSAATVTQDTSATINNLTLDSGDSWTLNNGESLTIDGTSISNAGMMTMNSTGGATDLIIGSSSVTLSGGGTLTLSNNANNLIKEAASGDTLTNQETIQGAGKIGNGGLKLVNSGTIDADQSAGLVFNVESLTNTGTLEATAGASLALAGITMTNTGGTISSSGTNSTVVLNGTTVNNGTVSLTGASFLEMNNASILGGTLNNSSTGTIQVSGYNNFLGGTLNNPAGGAIQIGTDSALYLKNGTYNNAGSITLNTTDFLTQLYVDGTNVVLSGGGTVALGANSDNEIIEAANGDKLTNNNTISGSGGSNTIGNGGLILVNSGTIEANASTSLTINNPAGGGSGGSVTNTGTLEATTAGIIDLASGRVTNTGTLEAASGGKVYLDPSATLTNFSGNTLTGGTYSVDGSSAKSTMSLSLGSNTGGEIVNNAANIYLYGSNANVSFVDANGHSLLSALAANSTAGSALDIGDGYNFTTAGNFTNKGELGVESGSKFVVNGNLTNFSGTTLTGGTYDIGGTFQFNNANIVTNATFIDLVDSTAEITNQLGKNALANFAINASGATFVLQGAALANAMHFTTAGNFTNDGTLVVAGNTKFTVNGNLTNFNSSTNTLTGGTYEIDGGTLQFNGANIVTNAANIQLAGGQILNQTSGNGLANFAVNAAPGTFTLWYDNSFTTAGNFTNNGTLTLEPGSTFKVNGNLTNFNSSTNTLAGGTYNIGGTLQFNGANIVTNAANLTLTGGSAQILSQTSANGLANFAVNASTGTFTLAGGQNFTTKGNFTNNGTLAVGSGSTFKVNGNLTNFNTSTNTLTGGTYNLTGALQFNGANIVTNAANITLTGASSQILSQTSANGLANLAVNAATGTFTLAGGRNFTTAGNFTNNGTLVVVSGSKFDVNGNLTNFNSSTNTLTGGTYSVGGTLQFNGANIVTNAANITLTGGSSQIINQTSGNALANFAVNAAAGSFTLAGGRSFTTAANFTNSGILTMDSGSTFDVNGNLTNFSAGTTTLTGGTYNLAGGTLQFNGANIVSNAANIILMGASAKFLSQTSANGLANLATNNAAGSFNLIGGATFTTKGNFTNSGTLMVGSGSSLSVTGNLTNLAGTTTDNGTLSLLSSGSLRLNGGSLLGQGTISGPLTSSSAGTIIPGSSSTTPGVLKETGAYTQNSGILKIIIDGTSAGSQYNQLNPTSASLSGTLNITRPTSFVPALGSTFKIMNFSSATGTFATVTGAAINSSEHFAVSYQASDVLLTVAAGAANSSRRSLNAHGPSLGANFGPGNTTVAQLIAMDLAGSQNSPPQTSLTPSVLSSSVLPTGALPQNSAGGIAGKPAVGSGPRSVSNRIAAAVPPSSGHTSSMLVPLAYHVEVLPLLEKGRRQALRNLWKQSRNDGSANSGYLTVGLVQ